MTAFNFDMSAAPRGKTITRIAKLGDRTKEVEDFISEPVWLATACNKVIKSEWIPETKHSRGRWAGVNAPIAWQPFIVPDHPGNNKIESGANAAADNSALRTSETTTRTADTNEGE